MGFFDRFRRPRTDGRNISAELGELLGEGGGQRVRRPVAAYPGTPPDASYTSAMAHVGAHDGAPTYYGQPLLKKPVWKGYIPGYFYVGGAAGALSALGMVAELAGGEELRPLVERCHALALAGDLGGSLLLVADLGVPSRFLHMFRVLRPTSPMSVGSFILGASGGLNTLAVLFSRTRLGKLAGVAAGALGVPLAGYTAVLIANSAIPIWQSTRRTLPPLFVATSMASAGALLEAARDLDAHAVRIGRRFGIVGKASTLVAMRAVERDAAAVPEVARALAEGGTRALWGGARVLTAASLAASMLPLPRRWRGVAACVLGTLGAIALRFAVMAAGKRSAMDPRASFAMQRAGRGAAEAPRRARKRALMPTVDAPTDAADG